ncbi:SusC/RagA family TonB-linked outer membrane protein [Niastella yeongjuensis]|uniref:SusC/RagA family TonB-linked outer membrane protein n=1 Tax=Niastella yeongjuensis TaxID=354355 RepID=A0A1V9EEE2_9BACT|nr:SusC/RagA family TonB-linked outer membrane protein [Niastella yeongjuensis]OQP44493.1 SusC/RagA family TonB-linked outer membrane protein [Niastella yeongjuensis]SEO85768.1 TonB-linked outer membrane protein, SusC/RagA family [Niastella yeongjuensis]
MKNYSHGRPPRYAGLWLLCIFHLLLSVTHAQTITGTVSDEKGTKLSRVSIMIKGSSLGTTTDNDGKYSISAPGNASLVFSAVGYKNTEVAIDGRIVINISLTVDNQNLGEVIVTALGIKKQARSLGYSATSVKPEELSVNRTSNVMNALQGKVAGVNISSLGTGPGGTSKIRIRGQSSISGQNNPLIVINGVPVDNTNFNDNTINVKGGGVYADGGDGLSSINPDDIESMTVLKGAPASALYGSRAKDGVIMITTKTKGKTKGIGVSYNLNYTNDTPLDYTDYQNEYGQGEGGVRPTTPDPTSGEWSFGEKFAPGMTQILFNNLTVPYEPQDSRIKNFYRHGQNISNTLAFESSNDKGGMRLSLNNTQNNGIVPNNSFNRKSMNLGYSYNLTEKFILAGNINYSREINKNPPNIANQDNSIPTTLMALSTSMPLHILDENKYNAQGNEYGWSRFTNRTNPYWVLAEQFHNIKRDRLFGNVTLKYNLLSWLSVQGRFGQDYWSRDEDVNNFPTGQNSRAAALPGFVNGVYTQESRRFRETNLDFLVNANRKFGIMEVNLNAGGNRMRKRSDINNVVVTDFITRGIYTVQNGRGKDPVYTRIEQGVNSLYSSAELNFKQTFYLTGTVRNDWFSTLAPVNRSILYPSVSGSYVFSEHLQNVNWLNFGKLRLGYAEVGSDGDVPPYSDQLFYSPNANFVSNPNGQQVPVGTSNISNNATGTTLPNPSLKPSRVAETEVGLEMRMFNNRINIDLAAYRKITKDQIVLVQISDASGYLNTPINSGKSRNYGFEAQLNLVPVRTLNTTWEFTANTSYNITKVLSIISDKPGERITTGTHVFNGETRHVVGQEMGQIAGYGYARDAKGQMIFQSNGLPQRTSDFVLFGSGLPKWVGGFLNTVNYKGINFTVFIDYKLGNKMLSGTNFNAVRHGLHKMTLQGREGGVIGSGVDANGNPNTAVQTVQTYWEHLRTQQIIEPVIYNGGYWKVRQLSLGYDFTKHVPVKWPIKGVKLDFVANNVLLIKKWVDNIDPETFGFGSDNQVGLESPGLPTTRSLGLNLNIKF